MISEQSVTKKLDQYKHRGYIIALIDDDSRFITGIDVLLQ